MLKAIINIHLKNGVLDSAGKTTQTSLNMLGFENIDSVNIGKQIIITLNEDDKEKVQKKIDDMCKSLLVNDVIEDYLRAFMIFSDLKKNNLPNTLNNVIPIYQNLLL